MRNEPGSQQTFARCLSPPVDPAEEYRRRCREGGQADLGAFLSEWGPLSPLDLAGVLRVEQSRRWETGDCLPVEQLLAPYPQVRGDDEATLDLIYGEYLLREQRGESCDPAEFASRFPGLERALQRQIKFHHALAGGLSAEISLESTSPAERRGSGSGMNYTGDDPSRSPAADYELIREIGRGGMGVVYEARQVSVNRLVALKVLTAGTCAGAEQFARLRTEAELVARLQDPHIVQIYGAGEHNGCPCLALEFMGGGSLRERLNGVPQLPASSARLIETLARAAHVAHCAGIIHRDLKPGNILFSSRVEAGGSSGRNRNAVADVAKIADFGLAKSISEVTEGAGSGALTRTGDILGTPCYMSPEQAAGQSAHLGAGADIYSLGAILYELLTGRPPFQGENSLAILQQVAADEPIAPSRLQPRLPRDLEIICLKCLEKHSGKRYATALDLADDLRRFLSDEPIRARPISRPARIGRWCRRRPSLASLAALVALLVMALLAGSLAATIRLRRAADARLVEARLAEARALRIGNQIGRRRQSLTLLAEAARVASSAVIRNEAIAAMALFDFDEAAPGPEFTADHRALEFDGRLERYVRSDRKGRVMVHNVADDGEICRLPMEIDNPALLLGPDGRTLALRSDFESQLQVWTVEHAPRMILTERCDSHYGFGPAAYSADSSLLAVCRPDGVLRLYSLPEAKLCRAWKLEGTAWHLALNPVRPQIAITGPGLLQVYSTDTGRLLVELGDSVGATRVAWHPSGRLLATADADLGLSLWLPDERRRHMKIAGHTHGGIELAFSREGSYLFTQGWDGMLRIADPWLGTPLYVARTWVTDSIRFSSDGQFWAGDFENKRARLRRFDTRPVVRRLSRGPDVDGRHSGQLSISPREIANGRLLAVAMQKGVGLWDLSTGRVLGQLPLVGAHAVAFDPAGSLLVSSEQGLWRWPVGGLNGSNNELIFGPPVGPIGPASDCSMSASTDGRVVAIGGRLNDAAVWLADRLDSAVSLVGHVDARYVAVSPDGRRVATGSHTGRHVRVWDARTGKVLQELPMESSQLEFSPDGAWLATIGRGLTLWSVDLWQAAWTGVGDALSAHAFSADGRVIAIESGQGEIVLYETRDGREIARLTDPAQSRQSGLAFSPDGSLLAAASHDTMNLCVWNLHEIGNRLDTLGAGWDLSGDRRTASSIPHAGDLTVTIQTVPRSQTLTKQLQQSSTTIDEQPDNARLYARRGRILWELDRPGEAVAALSRAIEISATVDDYAMRARAHDELGDHGQALADALSARTMLVANDPRESEICNQLAWYYATGPSELRKPELAVALARRALRRNPGQAAYLNTLGIALYHDGKWDEAIDALHRSLLAQSHSPAYDLYFLALCHDRLHDARQAAGYYHQAVYWHDGHANVLSRQTSRELAAIRQEVEQALASLERPRSDSGGTAAGEPP